MQLFHNDYNVACHPAILKRLDDTSGLQMGGYGIDDCCDSATERIHTLCDNHNLAVHYLVGGTQTNLTVIAASLRPFQGVVCADTGHINVHETGAIEATGHKVMGLPSSDGKIYAAQIERVVEQHDCMDAEHTVQPKMVYISNPTELGTIYTLSELRDISAVCKKHNLYLFLDGARLGYGLTAPDSDVTLADLAKLCDVFYIGGTKVGAMFGEAVVISHPAIADDFRYMIKQRGAMLAKGWLLGIQFDVLLKDNLYFDIAREANKQADMIRGTLAKCGYKFLVETTTNQIFPIMPDCVLYQLSEKFTFSEMERVDAKNRVVRFCTSWATSQSSVDELCWTIESLSLKNKEV